MPSEIQILKSDHRGRSFEFQFGTILLIVYLPNKSKYSISIHRLCALFDKELLLLLDRSTKNA